MADDTHPDWWTTNQNIREEFSLPEYDPPKFSDGCYTHTVISRLEQEHDCNISLLGIDTRYGDDWEVRIDGITAGLIGRYRNDKGNTIYEMTSSEFCQLIAASLKD
ncbi:hypothetical protein [Halalkalicoccus sp. NIPERK01]|uniref:hypothetical protein n=1 Tax=Halalkalicoccus sp. NIPERK01 TaxID=3053469 RepID=UPI00256F076A|nr:hypothetical protein [Halalkalicoccus sp. NIPERK01]